ncbi:MAG TPA: glucose-6-phosphate dehydrogenase [Burkholderiaceae bacterium]|nr:glucose-6-phosphate dehydrogenase [Burkholderiaceae bacterium]
MAGRSFDLVLFGGTGDLAGRKLLPGMYFRYRDGDIADDSRIIATARQQLTTEQFHGLVRERLQQNLEAGDFDAGTCDGFLRHIQYVTTDAGDGASFQGLRPLLTDAPERARVFFLATSPTFFTAIASHLAEAGLVTPTARVVLEKPLGRDLASSREINEAVGRIFSEDRIYRIDHYLGKESVQNLLALRFGNSMFEPLWSRSWVRDVQITIGEQVGVEGRGEFYNQTGALRDMVQNHLLQLLCIVAMEPPTSIDPDSVRDAKLQVLRSLKRFSEADIQDRIVRGQYRAGASEGRPVPGFLDEPGIPHDSRTETFVALKAELCNWRWAGVPFYLRTGKRMQDRLAEIVVNFRNVPHAILQGPSGIAAHNRLVIRLQPHDGLTLQLQAKTPGDGMRLQPIQLDLAFQNAHKARMLDAYERLLMDVIRGRLTLFMRRDEQEAAWAWVEPILDAWAASDEAPKPYTAGTWGPAASSALIGRDNRAWHEEV